MDTKEKIAVMQAYVDGETIQIYDRVLNRWIDITSNMEWDWFHEQYRIKPESKPRPYRNAKEFLEAQEEHGPYFTWKKDNGEFASSYQCPCVVRKNGIEGIGFNLTYSNLLIEGYYWQDGTPCGILEE